MNTGKLSALLFASIICSSVSSINAEELGIWGCTKKEKSCKLPGNFILYNNLFKDRGLSNMNMFELFASFPIFIEGFFSSHKQAAKKTVATGVTHLFAGDGAQPAIQIDVIKWAEGNVYKEYIIDVTDFGDSPDYPYYYKSRFKNTYGGWGLVKVTEIKNEQCCVD